MGRGASPSASAAPDPLLPLLELLALLRPALFPLRVPALFLAFDPLADPLTFFCAPGVGLALPP